MPSKNKDDFFTVTIMVIVYFLLVYTVFGILSLDELHKSVQELFDENNSNVYINSDGPLNLLYGYVFYTNRLIHKKRLFSPGLKINYSLTIVKDESSSKRNNSKDIVTAFEKNSGPTGKYLFKYYEAVKTMYNVVNEKAFIQTNRDQSLFRFLTQKLDKEDSFKLLAAMLLLAEGIELPLRVDKEIIKYKKSERTIHLLICEVDNKSLFKIGIYNIIEKIKDDGQVDLCFYKLKEIQHLVEFFITYGGNNVKTLNSYKLPLNDMPSYLIQSYIFEFIQNLEEAQLFFRVINNLLVQTKHGEDSEVWKKFFIKNKAEVKKYEPVYKTFKEVDRLNLKTGFPFSSYVPPPSTMTVKGYNEKYGRKTTNDILSFSDCCGITIYTLFCCLLYDPVSKEYKLDRMVRNGYIPSYDLRNFFEVICPKPVGFTSLHLHQQWVHVVQDQVLSEGELAKGGSFAKNTIIYRKEVNNVSVELKSEILNVLKVMAKITGMPRERMSELGEICAIVQNGEVKISDMKESISEYVSKIFKELSVMGIEIEINKMELLTVDGHNGLYGIIVIRFKPKDDDGLFVSEHIVQCELMEGHASAKVISKNNEIKVEDKRILEGLGAKCERIKLDLGIMAVKRVHEVLGKDDIKPVPLEMVEKVEQAQNDIERYLAINKILKIHRMETIDDRLYFIDLFAPYLDKMTKTNNMKEKQIDNEIVSEFIKKSSQDYQESCDENKDLIRNNELHPGDPLVNVISNIIGSVLSEEQATQFCFVQIFASCNEKYKKLFPSINGDVEVVSEFEDFNCHPRTRYSLLKRFHDHDAPNMLSKLYNRLRIKAGDMFITCVKSDSSVYQCLYTFMVMKCLKLSCSVGIKAIHKDFGIQGGRIVHRKNLLFRFNQWLDVVIATGYRKGFEEACEIWDDILNGENDRLGSTLFMYANLEMETRWYLLSGAFAKKLFKDEEHIKVLFEISLYCTYRSTDLDSVYEVFESHFTITLGESLMRSFENIIRDIRLYLSTLEASCAMANYELTLGPREKVKKCASCIERLKYFIKKIADFINTRDTCGVKLESNEKLADININVINITNDLLELEKRAIDLENLYRNQ
ncbi:hypothetical protein PAEPH01_0103 [Pancytospora epiphaga]|nr:hypothetical protein PAEPH01_0103 [Pancytospora epiphaga]